MAISANDLRDLEQDANNWLSAVRCLCNRVRAAQSLLKEQPSFVASGMSEADIQKIRESLYQGAKSEAFLLFVLQEWRDLSRLVHRRKGEPPDGMLQAVEVALANELKPIRFRNETAMTAHQAAYLVGRLIEDDCSPVFDWDELESENGNRYSESERQRDCRRWVQRIADVTPELLRDLEERIEIERIKMGRWLLDYTLLDAKTEQYESKNAKGKRFRVALSFPGERREFLAEVADSLARELRRERVFFDKYYEAELARPDLDTYLQGIYHDDSDLIAVFLCADYEKKEWCGLEWRAIRDLIKKRNSDAIMTFRFDSTSIPGLFSIDGDIYIGQRSANDVASFILERLEHNESRPRQSGQP